MPSFLGEFVATETKLNTITPCEFERPITHPTLTRILFVKAVTIGVSLALAIQMLSQELSRANLRLWLVPRGAKQRMA